MLTSHSYQLKFLEDLVMEESCVFTLKEYGRGHTNLHRYIHQQENNKWASYAASPQNLSYTTGKKFEQKPKLLTRKVRTAYKNTRVHYYPKYCKSLLM